MTFQVEQLCFFASHGGGQSNIHLVTGLMMSPDGGASTAASGKFEVVGLGIMM